jgi:hypothetical protein
MGIRHRASSAKFHRMREEAYAIMVEQQDAARGVLDEYTYMDSSLSNPTDTSNLKRRRKKRGLRELGPQLQEYIEVVRSGDVDRGKRIDRELISDPTVKFYDLRDATYIALGISHPSRKEH